MDFEETSPVLTTDQDVDISKIEAMVTPEQVFSANVARKRRTLTKKQSTNSRSIRKRTSVEDLISDSDKNDEIKENLTKTPERPHRRTKSNEKNNASTILHPNKEFSTSMRSKEGRNSLPREFLEELKDKTTTLAELAQNEINNLLNKTKRSISTTAKHGPRRSKQKTKEETKRSQSVPYEFTEDELMASLREAKLINNEKSLSLRRLSDSSPDRYEPKKIRAEVQEIIRIRKEMKLKNKLSTGNKIIEVLDPKTKNVVQSKTIIKTNVGLREFVSVLRLYKIKDIRKEYKKFKQEMKLDLETIRILRNKCFNELFVVILFCGIGGFIFKFTEGAFENFYKCGVKRVKRDFIELLWARSHSMREDEWKSLARNRLRMFEEELHAAHEAGMTSYSGQRSWSFLNGVVYSITVISTIGKTLEVG